MIFIVGSIALGVGVLFVVGGFSDRFGRDVSNKDIGTWMILDGVVVVLGAAATLLTGSWWPLVAATVVFVVVAVAVFGAAEGLDL